MPSEQDSTRVDRIVARIGVSKELVIGIVCLALGSLSTAVNLMQQDTGGLTIGIMLIALSLFWLNGGLTGHGSL